MGLMFDAKGVLYGTALVQWSDVISPLLRIDPSTGACTVIGSTGLLSTHGGDIAPNKVNVCHRTGRSGKFVPIELCLADLDDHLAHGDVLPDLDCECP